MEVARRAGAHAAAEEGRTLDAVVVVVLVVAVRAAQA